MRLMCIAAAVLAVASAAPAATILTPAAWGNVNTMYEAPGMFNAQPTWDGAAPVGGDSGYDNVIAGWDPAGSVGFIDLGVDWADWRIEQTWTKYVQWRSNPVYLYGEIWWDDDNDATNDGVAAPNTLFGSQVHDGSGSWMQDMDFTASPLVPQGRYLMLKLGAQGSSDANEYAFVGQIVPEPATMSLVLLGAVGLLRRKK